MNWSLKTIILLVLTLGLLGYLFYAQVYLGQPREQLGFIVVTMIILRSMFRNSARKSK